MRLLRKLYIQVLIAIALAIAFGLLAPHEAVKMRPLGESFIALLKMMLGPIIFCTVVHGVGHIKDVNTHRAKARCLCASRRMLPAS